MSISTTAVEFQSDKSRIAIMFKSEELKADSGFYEPYGIYPYNPDILVQKKGDLGVYDKMRRDDQIKSVLWLKKFMVLSTGWNIVSEEEDEQRDIINFLKNCLSNLEGFNFGDAIVDMLSHLDYGFSVTEPVFGVDNTNHIILKSMKTRAPHTFTFDMDEFGHIKSIIQSTADDDIEINPAKVIHLTHQSDFGNPYGTSDLQAAYRAWFAKDIMIRFWNIYLERFGNPHVIATVPSSLKAAEKDNIMDVLKTLQARSGIRVPEGVDLKLMFPPSGNTDFERAIDKYNMMIARSMLIPDLIGIGGKEISGGSFALGEKHFQLFYMTIDKIKKDLERIINQKIISPLCLWNFGLKENCPQWKLDDVADSDKNELLRIWADAVKGKLWKPSDEEINHFRRKVKFPESDDIERIKEPGRSPMPFVKTNNDDMINFGKGIEETYMIKLSREKTEYEKKVNFKKIDDDLNNIHDDAFRLFVPVFMKIKEGMLNLVESKKLVEKAKFDQINNLNVKFLKDLQIAFRQMLRNTYKAGFNSASNEIPIKKMSSHLPALFEKAIEERSFYLTGIESENIKKKVKQIILDGIDKGLTVQDVIFRLEEFFDADYSWITDNVKPAARLETIVRVNTIKAYNYGRRKMFESSELEGFVKAYQFSAILDARTSDLCNTLDENIYKINDPYINKITPPVHFNCRSLLVPIVEGEKFKESSKIDLEEYPNFGGTKKNLTNEFEYYKLK